VVESLGGGVEVWLPSRDPSIWFGDPTSYRLIEGVVKATCDSGAVRHGAECFNFYFPQELDAEYLIVWDGYKKEPPWEYVSEDGLREFLIARAKEKYDFPLNPVWPIRDKGWYDVFTALKNNQSTTDAFEAWYPPETGVVEMITDLCTEFPVGFERQSRSNMHRGLSSQREGVEEDHLNHEEMMHIIDLKATAIRRFQSAVKRLSNPSLRNRLRSDACITSISPQGSS